MKASDIGLVFGNPLASSHWARFEFIDGTPDQLWFGSAETSLGVMTVVGAGDDICYLGFDEQQSIANCRKIFPTANLSADPVQARALIDKIMAVWQGQSTETIRVIVRATPFQKQVWNTLMLIPNGHAISYGTIADYIGKPNAVRAVGTAVGSNPVSLFIPCHRVIQKSGKVENYLWGNEMKQRILTAEAFAFNQTSKSPASHKIPEAA